MSPRNLLYFRVGRFKRWNLSVYDMFLKFSLVSTQLNSTNHPKIKEWFNKKKEAKKV